MRDRARAGDDGAPPPGDPRRRVVGVGLVDVEQPGRLREVRREHGARGQRHLVAQPRQHPEREGVEQHRGVAALERAEHGADQRGGALGLVQAGADHDGVRALELGGQVRGRLAGGGAVLVLGQGEHARLRGGDRERGGDGLRHGEREPAGADPQRGQPGERRGPGRAARAADDEHAAPGVLGAVARGQRPVAQQGGGQRGRVSHRPAPGAR
ncbi:hypothetical protein Cpa01nite_05590 [Cellulomonas pakistanensis]|uniref:Uncharacterized protein n=1 Tax=Cellulomonas pakistanensis TaxID=992287 RepID=A0A919P8Q4_9CELL|nr:hypothetical protein Cpa01nite_05590 [Cellulomonas pakistanensis]